MPSTPVIPFAQWASGTNQNSIPANDNSRRNQILNGNIISQSVTAQPASPAEGDAYIIAATHTGAQWAGFTPKDLAIYSGGTWYAFAPAEGNRVSVAGSIYIYTSGNWTLWSGGVGGDMFSPLLAAEIAVTAATTLTLGRMHVCSGTTADYAVTLPAASGNAGKFIGVRMAASGLTRWVTVTGNGAELIDGQNTRRMWAKETAILLCDGTGWTKVAGKTVPLHCVMNRTTTTAVSMASSTFVAVPMNQTLYDNASSMATTMADLANGRIRTLRTGRYQCSGMVSISAPSGTTLGSCVVKDGVTPDGQPSLITTATTSTLTYAEATVAGPLLVTALGYITLSAYQDNASPRSTRIDFVGVVPNLSIMEMPDW